MRIAVMQPYFLPYLGYFQLLSSVDRFVLLDDVNFINRGWIHRNRIWIHDSAHWLTLPIVARSQNRRINEHQVQFDSTWHTKISRTLQCAYARTDYYHAVSRIVPALLDFTDTRLAVYLRHTLQELCSYLDLNTPIDMASEISPRGELRGVARILAICQTLRATTYVNAPGGRALYLPEEFQRRGIELEFSSMPALRQRGITGYPPIQSVPVQSAPPQIPLSILDLMMHNAPQALRDSMRVAPAIAAS